MHRKKSLFSAFFVATLDNFGFAIVFILFAPLMLDSSYGMVAKSVSLDTRNLLLALLYSAFPLMQFFGAPIFGDLGDRFGRKQTLIITIAGSTLGLAISAAAIVMHSIPLLFVSRLITGFFAGNLSICLAIIADLCEGEKERAKVFGYITVAFAVSWTIAMILGGYVAPLLGPSMPLWFTAALSLIGLIFVLWFFEETHTGTKKIQVDIIKGIHNIRDALKILSLRPFFGVNFLRSIGWGLVIQWYVALALQRYGVTQELASWGLVALGFLWCVGGLLIGPLLLKKFATRGVAIIAFLLTAILIAPTIITPTFFSFALFIALSGMTASVTMSTTTNLISISAPAHMQGRAMGLSQSVMSLGWFCVPAIGALFASFPLTTLFGIGALLHFGALLLLAIYKPKEPT